MEKRKLEEAAETELYLTINKIIDGGKDLPKGYNVSRAQAIDYAFDIAVKIAKWQAERMYSEEEVEKIVRDAYTFGEKEFKHFGAFEEWFEQFKKK